MPSLKDLKCSIELSGSQQILQEFGTTYGNSWVEAFVPVPSKPQPFSVHLTSENFIAPGISMYVFIDGVYQCNRNRQGLKLRIPPESSSLVDFRVRQKEERQKDGTMIAREWKFEKFDTVSADKANHQCSPDVLANIGCIEVVVLRCVGPRFAKTASHMNMDGASDSWDHVSDMKNLNEETSRDSIYSHSLPYSRRRDPGPPPPLGNYHSPYAETLRSHGRISARNSPENYAMGSSIHPITESFHDRSRPSGPVSPSVHRSSRVPTFGIQYGSGPLPPVGEPFYQKTVRTAVPSNSGVDPLWLDQVVTKAVKQGVVESQRISAQQDMKAEKQRQNFGAGFESQLPGAWPTSPFDVTSKSPKVNTSSQATENHDSLWGHSQSEREEQPTKIKSGSRVSWINADLAWDSSSSADGWNSQGEIPSDSWDTDETWGTKKVYQLQKESPRGSSRDWHSSSRWSRATSPATIRIRGQQHSQNGLSVSFCSRSKSRGFRADEDITFSSESASEWEDARAASSSTAGESSNDTVQPSNFHSLLKTPRGRSKKQSYRSRNSHASCRRQSLQSGSDSDLQTIFTPSRLVTVTPTLMNNSVLEQKDKIYGVHTDDKLKTNHGRPKLTPYAPIPDIANRGIDPSPFDINSFASSSWNDHKKLIDQHNFRERTMPRKGSWKDSGHNAWGSHTDEQAADGWKTAGKTSWDSAFATQDTDSDAWAGDLDTWKSDPFLEERKRDTGNNTAWENSKPGWNNRTTNNNTATSWTDRRDRGATQPTDSKNEANQWKAAKHETNNAAASTFNHQPQPASDTGPKPHWQFPPPPPPKTIFSSPDSKPLFIAPKEPLHKISKHIASEKGIEHQVQAGKATYYGHAISRPEYLDPLHKPYATFRFKYRSRAMLRSLFDNVNDSDDDDDDDGKKPDLSQASKAAPARPKNAAATATATATAATKQKLPRRPRSERAERTRKSQTRVPQGRSSMGQWRGGERKGEKERLRGGEPTTDCVARGLTEEWVDRQVRARGGGWGDEG